MVVKMILVKQNKTTRTLRCACGVEFDTAPGYNATKLDEQVLARCPVCRCVEQIDKILKLWLEYKAIGQKQGELIKRRVALMKTARERQPAFALGNTQVSWAPELNAEENETYTSITKEFEANRDEAYKIEKSIGETLKDKFYRLPDGKILIMRDYDSSIGLDVLEEM